jgi:ribosomal protein S18 acetylase RimI-like enzyme
MILIQHANPSDADALSRIAFAAKAHWGYPVRWLELWKPQLTFTPDYFDENESWVAVDGETPIAFYTLQDKNEIAWLENLWVLPNFIGRGVGKELFFHAVDLARRRGYKILQLESDPSAIGFYEKMGMRRIGERRSEVDGQPRILPLMEIAL